MGQVPCSCQSHCEPLVNLDKDSSTVKVDAALLRIFDDACSTATLPSPGGNQEDASMPEKTQSYLVARDMLEPAGPPPPTMQRCPARQTSEEQVLRRLAMVEAASEAAEAAAFDIAEQRSLDSRITRELQAQLQDADMRNQKSREANLLVETLEGISEDELASQEEGENVEIGCLPVWIESASQEAAEEAEEAAEKEAQAAEKAATIQSGREVQQQENAAIFLKAQGFRTVTSKRRKLLSACYPLHVAVEQNDAEVVRCLLLARADVNQRSSRFCSTGRRLTPRAMAARRDRGGSHAEVLSVLDAELPPGK